MKKLKMILALIIAMIVLCTSSLCAFATETQEDAVIYAKIEELHDLCMMAVNVYGAFVQDGNYSHDPGIIYLSISNFDDINAALKNATDLIHRYGYPMIFENYNGITRDEINDAYDNLKAEMDKATVVKGELKVLIDFCLTEKNDNYYPDEAWSKFKNSISEAQVILDDVNSVGDDYNRAYWDMLYNYNKLCIINQEYGDINFDGQVNIFDVTKLQRILAQLENSNSSIRQISRLDINYVTDIQRLLASLTDDISVYPARFEYMITNVESTNYHSQQWYFNSWRMNYLFLEYIGHC